MTNADNGGEAGFCFHPADEPRSRDGSVSPCFHPADEPRSRGGSVSPCFQPGDADISAGVNLCHHSADPGNGAGCFHPTDSLTGNVNCCFHPADDDLAADLHLSLTGIDEHHLAALAPSRP